jgi:serine/threonine protein kinase
VTGSVAPEVERRLVQYIEARTGELSAAGAVDLSALCADRPDLLPLLRPLVERYERLERAFEDEGSRKEPLPSFPGFRTVERLGRGGEGDVYKVEDLTLGRIVAAKVLRRDSPLAAGGADLLREAKSLALSRDPRFVKLLEFRPGDPPVLLMEYVLGFELTEIGRSLEFPQRARLMAEVAEALQRAHELGFQHRDLKPGNILVEPNLRPRILDLGLARGEPDRGHGKGTLAYMAPEQLDPTQPIDALADVYALGVVLYELLCGSRPYAGVTDEETIQAVREGTPRLPVEVDPRVPEPLQAVALKAMARERADRYASAHEMALDLRRYAEGRPVLARPPLYRTALERRVQPHLEQVEEWERLRLIYPHEGQRLRAGYRQLEAREDDWIVQSRLLSFSQISLYLGAFLIAAGSVLYLDAYLRDAVTGLAGPGLLLGVPFVALNAVATRLYARSHQAAAVAFHLGAAALLPLAVLILLRESGLLLDGIGGPNELFSKVTNRQVQLALGVACAWLGLLAARTRTVALSSGFAAALLAWNLALLGDLGLRRWVEEGRWDAVAMGLTPLVALAWGLGRALESVPWPWFASPLYFGGSGLGIAVLEMLALNGKAFAHLGITLAPVQPGDVSDPRLLDTIAAMTLVGVLFYVAGTVIERRGTPLTRTPAGLLHALSPFAILEPIAYLNETGEYGRSFDWLYLALALAIAFASRFRQRRSFYYSGVLNTGLALYFLTDHYGWRERPAWAAAVLAAGVVGLLAGLAIDWRARRLRTGSVRE